MLNKGINQVLTSVIIICNNDYTFWEICFLFDKLLKLLLKRSKDNYYRKFFNTNIKSSMKTWNKMNDLISKGKNRQSKFQIVIN